MNARPNYRQSDLSRRARDGRDRIAVCRGQDQAEARAMNRPVRSPHDIKGISFEYTDPIALEAPEPLSVQFLPGSGTRLVICFAGVGRNRSQTPPREFTGTASAGSENHVLFISDRSRSWMNGPGIAGNILATVKRFMEFHRITEVVTLGNSMGGFAACVLAQLMPVKTVIAFSPQYSMHPDLMPGETRWDFYRDQIANWTWRDIGELELEATRYFFFHGDHPLEAQHWLRFSTDPRINHFIFKGMGHDVAARLRKRQLLTPVVANAIAGRPKKIRKMIEASPLGRRFEVYRREAYHQKFPDVMQGIDGPAEPTHPGDERTTP